MSQCTDLKDSCCVERITILEDGDVWIIKRRPGFNLLSEFRKPEKAYPDIFITPGQNPKVYFHIVPMIIEYPKKYADLTRLLEETIPAIRAKEDECDICRKVINLLKSSLLKKEG